MLMPGGSLQFIKPYIKVKVDDEIALESIYISARGAIFDMLFKIKKSAIHFGNLL